MELIYVLLTYLLLKSVRKFLKSIHYTEAARSKAQVSVSSVTEVAGLNAVQGMDVRLLCLFCVGN